MICVITLFATQATAEIVAHKIERGETLFTIAHAYHSSIKEVRELNGLQEDEVLKPGNMLQVPANTYFPENRLQTHTVVSGETLSGIAHRFHTKVALIKKLNGISKSAALKIGTTLKIPLDTYFASKENVKNTTKNVAIKQTKPKTKIVQRDTGAEYTIKKGDTLYTIAKKHHMTVAQLVRLNKIAYKATLKTGEKLKVVRAASVKKKITKHLAKRTKNTSKSNRILRTVLKRQSKPLSSQRIRGYVKASEDIFFKSMQPNKKYFGTKIDKKKAYRITSLAKQKLGRRYVWGATGQNAFDCSGLTTFVYKKNGILLPRRAIAQSRVGKRVPRSELKPGDLVFFDTSKHHRGYVNHVGIYIGNGKFIHASSAKKKVVITSLSKPFYAQRFKVARRLTSAS